MAIDFDTNPGGLFRRLGRIIHLINSTNAFRGSSDLSAASIVSIGTGITNIVGQYGSTDQQLIDAIHAYRDSARASLSGFTSTLSQLASSTIIEMANDDAPLPSLTLSVAMKEVIDQMIAGSEDVDANTVSVSAAAGSGNTGTAVCATSVKGPDGLDREYVLAETITLRAANDSQSNTATAGRESWSISSPVPQGDQLSWDWPKGSGIATSTTSVAADGPLNRLANGDMEDFTSNVPDKWTVVVGTAGTHILRAATPYTGTYSLSFVGDGSNLTAIRQKFNDSSVGTSYRILPSTVYAIHFWHKVSATPATGVLNVTLTDSGGTAVANDASATCEITKDLTASTTSWAAVNGFIQTPSVLPTAPFYLKVHLSTALENAVTLYIDDLTMAIPTQVYTGGPYVAVFPGATATVKDDEFAVTVANNWAGAFQKAFQQMFDMRQLGLALPSDSGGTETIPDSLIA